MSSIEWVGSNFDYIIIDEAHYLFQDALFNRNTEIMLDMVEQLQKSKVIVLMSATAAQPPGLYRVSLPLSHLQADS